MSFLKLTEEQIQTKIDFINTYKNGSNAATSSNLDPNANITQKNMATLEYELHKDVNVQVNRAIVSNKIKEMYGQELATEYVRQIEDHEIYVHDETSLKPYTYGASEAIVVYKEGRKLLTTFELLYDVYSDLDEELLDEEKGVWGKYPTDLYIEDVNGKTKITRLVKKKRHRDMVRIKTKYGEDLIVTDNHPLIINQDDINDNVDAIDGLGKKQFKRDTLVNMQTFNSSLLLEEGYENYGSYVMRKGNDGSKIEGILPEIGINGELGYALGFFIAEGSYLPNGITMCQNNKEALKTVASYIYNTTGIVGKIYKEETEGRSIKYKLDYTSKFLKELFIGYFGVLSLAQHKNIPQNIYETNDDFIDGLLSGIIDGDGSVGKNISIRLASRTLISQLSILLRSYGFGISNTYQVQPEQAFGSYSSNYPIFGISFGLTGELEFTYSEKVNRLAEKITTSTRYKEGESEIISVDKIVNDAYLDNYIYDITTESNHFLCNNIQVHNCVSVNMYPLLLKGMTALGGESSAPKNIYSFVGNFVNMTFAIAAQFAGAVATVEFLMYFDHFARKEFGEGYTKNLTPHLKKELSQLLQHVVYSINQPAVARG